MFTAQIEYKTFTSEIEYNNAMLPPAVAYVDIITQNLSNPHSYRVLVQDRRTGKVIRHYISNDQGTADRTIVSNAYLGQNNIMAMALDDSMVANAFLIDHIEPTQL